jgi:predicted neutral ceramidase superfamily lipid hydrolase
MDGNGGAYMAIEDKYRGKYLMYFATIIVISVFSIALVIIAIVNESWYPLVLGCGLFFTYYIIFWVEMRKLLMRYRTEKYLEESQLKYNLEMAKESEDI